MSHSAMAWLADYSFASYLFNKGGIDSRLFLDAKRNNWGFWLKPFYCQYETQRDCVYMSFCVYLCLALDVHTAMSESL